MIIVHVSGHLKDYTGKKRDLEVEIGSAKSVRGLIRHLNSLYPGIGDRIVDEQDVTRPYVNIFVNGEDIRDRARENTTLKDGDVVHVLPSVAGG